MRKRLAVLALGVIAVCCLATSAEATVGCYPACVSPTATVSTTNLSPKQTETVHGSFWCPDAVLTISFDSTPIATATVNKNGAFNAKFMLPQGTSTGTHTVTVSGSAYQCTAPGSVSITVNVSGGSTSATSLVLTMPPAESGAAPTPTGYTFRYADIGIVLCFVALFLVLSHKSIWRSHPRRTPLHVRMLTGFRR